MPRLGRTQADFDAKICECGHPYGRHPWQDNPIGGYGWCIDCSCRQRRDAVSQAEYRRQRAIAADPTHLHGSTHTAYACPGWKPIQLCDECGSVVEPKDEPDGGWSAQVGGR